MSPVLGRGRARAWLAFAIVVSTSVSLGTQLPGAPPAPTQPLVTSGGQAPAGLPTEVGEPGSVEARFDGTPAEAMAAIARLSADEAERAVALAREMAEDGSLAEELRAEFRFAEGVVLAEMGAPSTAVQPFLSARALAGPGELRDAATYDQGTAQLLVAEALREEAFRAMMDPGAAGGAPSSIDPEDPFQKPRAAYLRAKATLLERLAEGGDLADTRANLELIQRRLKELDQLEDQQEEQEEPQDQQQQDGDEQQEGEGEEGEEGEQEDGDEQQDQQEQGEQDDQQQPPDQDESSSDPDVNQPEQEQTAPDSGELPEVQETPAQPDAEQAERRLSREQVLRLLDTLEALEGEREELEAQLRAVQRIPVKQDW